MSEDPIRLEKLPGHRRGLINGASAWLASDHILLVRSHRFKEEYKRYYLRDIQAIAVARASRFHFSSRMLFVLALWIIALFISLARPSLILWLLASLVGLAAVWLYISAARSCVCRIYTTVSSDPLPSVYRTWTARKFLAIIEPRIREVQGELDPNWIQAVEQRPVGPEAVRDAVRADSAPSIVDAPQPPDIRTGASRTLASDFFLAALLLEAGADVIAFRNHSATITWAIAGLGLLQIAAAILIFMDRNRGRLRSPVHKVAIAKLIWVTLLFYSNAIAISAKMAPATVGLQLVPANDVLRGADVVLSIAFVAAGLILTYRPEAQRPTTLLS